MPIHRWIKPDQQRAACLEGFVVRLPVRRAVLLWSWFHPFRLPDLRVLRWSSLIYATKPHLIGNSVDDQQIVRVGDPNTNGSTNPTHSQLAKDHDNHPFHTLAAELAKIAVKEVGSAVASHWWKGETTADPALIARGFLTHPFDTSWQDKLVADWARKHPQEVKRGESATEWEAMEKAHKEEVLDSIERAKKTNQEAWNYINKNFTTLFNEKNQIKK